MHYTCLGLALKKLPLLICPHSVLLADTSPCLIFCELSLVQVGDWLSEVDYDNDGMISFEEFSDNISGAVVTEETQGLYN